MQTVEDFMYELIGQASNEELGDNQGVYKGYPSEVELYFEQEKTDYFKYYPHATFKFG